MPDFKALLDQQVDDVKAPVPLPTGTYQFVVNRHEFNQKGEKNTNAVDFIVKPMAAMEDVDEELLAQVEKWKEKEMKLTYWITADSLVPRYRIYRETHHQSSILLADADRC